MRRAALAIAFALAVMVLALGADAQTGRKLPRVGVLAWERCPGPNSVFGVALSDLGYSWGQTIDVLCRSAEENHAKLQEVATTLVTQKVDVVAAFSHITAYAARRATPSTPIVMIASGDPVRSGLVVSLARPGGNVTGLTYYGTELVEKRLQLLREMVPRATRVAVLGNSESDHVFGLYRQDADRAARTLGFQLVTADASQPRDLDRAFDTFVQNGAEALLVLTDPMLRSQAQRIVGLAAQHRLPAMYWGPWFMDAGGLAAYSADYDSMVRRAAYYVDRILKGARPADIPVEQPTRFELVINLKTAKALGLTVPPSLLARADKVVGGD